VALRPLSGDWRDAGIVRRARELKMPPLLVTMHSHPGELPASGSLAALSSTEIELTALKLADEGDGYVVRITDRHGRGGTGELAWLGECFAVTLAPFEVLTLRLTRRADGWQATECDMLERPLL
jgi:alpha-mannosidase